MEKTKGELLKEQLFLNRKDATDLLSDEEMQKVFDFCEPYKKFMDAAKIENEAVAVAVEMLEVDGFALGRNMMYIAMVPALAEEFLFRGIFYHSYRPSGIWKAALVSG